MCAPLACSTPPPFGDVAQAEGEQHNGFPSAWERALHMATNRARSDPATVKGPQSAVLPATAPLAFQLELGRSARFHATTLARGKAPLMHDSPCTLRSDVASSGCDGTPACACTTGQTCMSCSSCPAGTDPWTRIGYFYAAGATGEVAAAGYGDPWSVVDGWVDEAAGKDGHRQILDDAGHGIIGFGHTPSPSGACWDSFDVGDVADAKPKLAKIPSAAPKPIGGAAGAYQVYATWADPSGGAPQSLNAVVDGQCVAMKLELGSPTLNATYVAATTLAAGCHSVYIVGHDAAGARWAYPTTRAFTIAVGNGDCLEDVAQPAAACESGTGGGGGGSGTGGGGGGGTGGGGGGGTGGGGGGGKGTGGGGGGGVGGGGGGGGSGTGGGGGGGTGGGGGGAGGGGAGGGGAGGGDPAPGNGNAHGGCSAAPGATATGPLALLLPLALLAFRRRSLA